MVQVNVQTQVLFLHQAELGLSPLVLVSPDLFLRLHKHTVHTSPKRHSGVCWIPLGVVPDTNKCAHCPYGTLKLASDWVWEGGRGASQSLMCIRGSHVHTLSRLEK